MAESYLTPKQKQVLEWIERYLSVNQTMPSRREIALGLGLSSPATIQQHIEALEKKGYLKRGETRESRALQWTQRSKKLLSSSAATHSFPSHTPQEDTDSREEIPLLGSIAAGYPIEVFPETRKVALPLDLFFSSRKKGISAADLFILSVRGDSMIDEGILPGDWVVLRKSTHVKSGATVAALINGEATLKTIVHRGSKVELHPANPKYPVIHINPEDRFEIQGVLVGLIRRFEQ